MSRQYISPILTALVAVCAAASISAQCDYVQRQTLYGFLPEEGSAFGDSAATDGARALIGASAWHNDSGLAVLYEHDGYSWLFKQELLVNQSYGDRFGCSVAIAGDVALVGAMGMNSETGAVVAFRWNGQELIKEDTLVAPDAAIGDRFGYSVALDADGDVAAIGAVFADGGKLSVGAVYVYEHDGVSWKLDEKLLSSRGRSGDQFGFDVDLDKAGTRLAVAAPNADAGTGFVNVFGKAGSWSEEVELTDPDGHSGDVFGWAIDLDRTTLAVGAPGDDQGFLDNGSVIVFGSQGGWSLDQKLVGPDLKDNGFGRSLALTRDRLVIGMGGYDGFAKDAGGAVIYRRQGGNFENGRIVRPIKLESGDRFGGGGVCASNDQILIGTPHGSIGIPENTGTVAVFTLGPSPVSQKLVEDPRDVASYFGHSVDVEEGVALVGAPHARQNGIGGKGRATFYRHDGRTWALDAVVTNLGDDPLEQFGKSVALSHNTAVIGAPGDFVYAGDEGTAVVFRNNGGIWGLHQILFASDAGIDDAFGEAVAIDGDTIAVTAPRDNSGNPAVYLFEPGGPYWKEKQKLTTADADGATGNLFGASISIDGDWLAVGAPQDDDRGTDTGAVYMFFRSNGGWAFHSKLYSSQGSHFGADLCLDGEKILISQLGFDSGRGAAWAFDFDGTDWTEPQVLIPADSPESGAAITSVSLRGSVALLGAGNRSGVAIGAGAAYLFRKVKGIWNQAARYQAFDASAGSSFGDDVAIDGECALIGAPLDPTVIDDEIFSAGAAYTFEVGELFLHSIPPVVTQGEALTQTVCGGKPGEGMLLAVVDVNGTPGFIITAIAGFDGQGLWDRIATIPAGLAGLDLVYQAFGVARSGKILASNTATLSIR